jgi:hypothetical protein
LGPEYCLVPLHHAASLRHRLSHLFVAMIGSAGWQTGPSTSRRSGHPIQACPAWRRRGLPSASSSPWITFATIWWRWRTPGRSGAPLGYGGRSQTRHDTRLATNFAFSSWRTRSAAVSCGSLGATVVPIVFMYLLLRLIFDMAGISSLGAVTGRAASAGLFSSIGRRSCVSLIVSPIESRSRAELDVVFSLEARRYRP